MPDGVVASRSQFLAFDASIWLCLSSLSADASAL
jgi:hypothetical protein